MGTPSTDFNRVWSLVSEMRDNWGIVGLPTTFNFSADGKQLFFLADPNKAGASIHYVNLSDEGAHSFLPLICHIRHPRRAMSVGRTLTLFLVCLLDSLAQLDWHPLLGSNEQATGSTTEALSKEEALRRERMRASLGLHTFAYNAPYAAAFPLCHPRHFRANSFKSIVALVRFWYRPTQRGL